MKWRKIKVWTVPKDTPNADSQMQEHYIAAETFDLLKKSGKWATYVEQLENIVPPSRFICKIELVPLPVQS